MIPDLSNWKPCKRPTNAPMNGQYIDIAPWDGDSHASGLWDAFGREDANDLLFHFGWPQLNDASDLAGILNTANADGSFATCVFCEKGTGRPLGMANYMSFAPEHGRVETGAIAHGGELNRTRAATEAHYLMARRVFDELGYRRYEWKLNNPNDPSHAAARRFGFTFEGVFRQHMVMPYGNRDTAWYSMLDSEWPTIRAAFEKWLAPENFDAQGNQRKRLQDIRKELS